MEEVSAQSALGAPRHEMTQGVFYCACYVVGVTLKALGICYVYLSATLITGGSGPRNQQDTHQATMLALPGGKFIVNKSAISNRLSGRNGVGSVSASKSGFQPGGGTSRQGGVAPSVSTCMLQLDAQPPPRPPMALSVKVSHPT